MRNKRNYRETFTTFTLSLRYVRFRERREHCERFYRTHGNSQKVRIHIYGGKRFTTFTTFTGCHKAQEGRS